MWTFLRKPPLVFSCCSQLLHASTKERDGQCLAQRCLEARPIEKETMFLACRAPNVKRVTSIMCWTSIELDVGRPTEGASAAQGECSKRASTGP